MNSDESLQHSIEGGEPGDGGADSKSYRLLFNSLSKEPPYLPPVGFADRVIQRAIEARSQKESRRDFWWLTLGIVLLSIAGLIAFAFVGFSLKLGALSSVINYGGFAILGGLLVLIFNVLDKRLLSHQHQQSI